MRVLVLCLAISALVPGFGGASIVIHDGQPGIVASDGLILDYNGLVWGYDVDHWVRVSDWDPPIPVDQIKFWERDVVVSMDNKVWMKRGDWIQCGVWPGAPASVERTSLTLGPTFVPNPSSGSCRVSFRLLSDGPVSVQIFDVSGRVVRHLIEGRSVAGDYSPVWDGRDDEGHDLPSGTYVTQTVTSGGTSVGKVVVAR